MRRTWIAMAVLGVAMLALGAISPPESRVALLRIAIFGVALVAALRVIRRVAPGTASAPDPFDVEPAAAGLPTEIAGLRRIEFDVEMATVHPFGLQWVRPLLRDLARARLLGNRGIDMERHPEAARRVLGEHLWRLIGMDAGPWVAGADRVSPAELEAGAVSLERV